MFPIALGVGFVEGLAGLVVFVPQLLIHVPRLHDQRLRARLGIEKAHLFVELRPFEAQLLRGHAVLDDALAVGIGSVILEWQMRQCPILHKATDHNHSQGHEPFLLGVGAAALHRLCGNQVEGQIQHWEPPLEHALGKQVGHKKCTGIQEGGLTGRVELNAPEECAQQNGRYENQKHHILEEALVGRQGDGIAKTPALQNTLVGDFHHITRRVHDFLGAVWVARGGVPCQPGEKDHHHRGQHCCQLRQRPHKDGDAQQDLSDAHKHGQFQPPRHEELEVHCAWLEVLFKLVHEAQRVVGFDQPRDHKQCPHEHPREPSQSVKCLQHILNLWFIQKLVLNSKSMQKERNWPCPCNWPPPLH